MPLARTDEPHEEVVERAGTVPLMNGTTVSGLLWGCNLIGQVSLLSFSIPRLDPHAGAK
jgi:hypothetical protein